MSKKISLWQFFTCHDSWLRPQVIEFILGSGKPIAFDPFAGSGHLLRAAQTIGMTRTKGLDIDGSLAWRRNDSLKRIPLLKTGIIVTNPPYLTNYSAKRKGLYADVERYFTSSRHDDLYKIALERCLEAAEFVVAIVPETIINSSFPKARLASLTILEENPFKDTDTPVCVACFDGTRKRLSAVRVYKNDAYVGRLSRLENKRLTPSRTLPIKFNAPLGAIALRAVDQVRADGSIRFMRPEELGYDLSKIGQSSRLITRIEIGWDVGDLDQFIAACNDFLQSYRNETSDLLFSPFKWNRKDGSRRRRIDYKSARAIIEAAYRNVNRS